MPKGCVITVDNDRFWSVNSQSTLIWLTRQDADLDCATMANCKYHVIQFKKEAFNHQSHRYSLTQLTQMNINIFSQKIILT